MIADCQKPECRARNRIPDPPKGDGKYRCGKCGEKLAFPEELEKIQVGTDVVSGWLSGQRVLAIASIIFLLLAVIGEWPYGFYTLLRFLVCGSAAYLAFQAHARAMTPWVWTMGITAVLFNPIIPIYLTRSIWRPIDFLAAVLFGVSVIVFRRRVRRG